MVALPWWHRKGVSAFSFSAGERQSSSSYFSNWLGAALSVGAAAGATEVELVHYLLGGGRLPFTILGANYEAVIDDLKGNGPPADGEGGWSCLGSSRSQTR